MIKNLVELDEEILRWVQEYLHSDILTPIMKGVTYSFNYGLLPFALSTAFLCFKKTRKLGILCACSVAATFLIDNVIIKNIADRIRPYESLQDILRLIAPQSDYSFPSGHSASAFTIATVIYKECSKKFGIPALIYASLVALSRVYLGVHYPSDVITGAVTGALFAYITCLIYHKKFENKCKNKE